MFLCHGPLRDDILGYRPPFVKILSLRSHMEKKSVVNLVSKGTEVKCVSVQNVRMDISDIIHLLI